MKRMFVPILLRLRLVRSLMGISSSVRETRATTRALAASVARVAMAEPRNWVKEFILRRSLQSAYVQWARARGRAQLQKNTQGQYPTSSQLCCEVKVGPFPGS